MVQSAQVCFPAQSTTNYSKFYNRFVTLWSISSISPSIVKTASVVHLRNIHDVPIVDFTTKIFAEVGAFLKIIEFWLKSSM